MKEKKAKLSIFSWCLYDWANTAFSTVIVTFIFSVYFSREVYGDVTQGSAQWSLAIGVSGLFVAILAPAFGTIADNLGARKRWIFWLSLLCILPCALLWFATPQASLLHIIFILALLVVANIGLELAQVFYNAMLPHIAPKNKMGRVSGWAWGLGYLGGLTALSASLFVFVGVGDVKPFIALNSDKFEHIRIVGPFVALWFLIFMVPLFLYAEDVPAKAIKLKTAILNGFEQLVRSIKDAKNYKNFLRFLIASAIYRDGLVTLFAIGGVYAAGQYDMAFTEILIFAIGLNVTAGLGAFAFAYMDDAVGSKSTIMISLMGLIVIGVIILMTQDKDIFLILSLGLGIFIGPVQAASRTFVSTLCPPDMMTQGYGLYAFTGKSISFLGPLMFGSMTALFNSQQAGMASIILLWFVGLIILLKVKENA